MIYDMVNGFLVNSYYKMSMNKNDHGHGMGVQSISMTQLWKACAPSKVQIPGWRLLIGKLWIDVLQDTNIYDHQMSMMVKQHDAMS